MICRDSDSEYLYNPNIWYFNKSNNYIFHTYSYSIENYYCIGEFLDKEFDKISLSRIPSINFTKLLNDFSLIFAPILCCWLTDNSSIGLKKQEEMVNMKDFCKSIRNNLTSFESNFLLKFQDLITKELGSRVENYIQNKDFDFTSNQNRVLSELATSHQISLNDLFLYFNGHFLFENFLLPIMAFQNWFFKVKIKKEWVEESLSGEELKEKEKEQIKDIKKIIEQIHKDSINHKTPPINKIWHDLMKTTF